MASKSRREKRRYKDSSTGKPIVVLHKRKVVKDYQNDGGFYEGMPGVKIDSVGNRKIIDFIITEKGEANAYLYAHPRIAKTAIENSMDHSELRSLILSACVDRVFKNKWNPLYFLVRLSFRFKKWTQTLKMNKKRRKLEKEQKQQENG